VGTWALLLLDTMIDTRIVHTELNVTNTILKLVFRSYLILWRNAYLVGLVFLTVYFIDTRQANRSIYTLDVERLPVLFILGILYPLYSQSGYKRLSTSHLSSSLQTMKNSCGKI